MDGWIWYKDESGFTVSVPGHWRYWRAEGAVCFAVPRSSKILGIGAGPLDAPGMTLLLDREWMLAEPAREREFGCSGPPDRYSPNRGRSA